MRSWLFFLDKNIRGRRGVATKKPAGENRQALVGWKTGFEPATSGTTIQRSNQLSYNHHFACLESAFRIPF